MLAALGILASGRVHREHRGFSPPPAEARFDVPLWIVLLVFAGMGTLAPIAALWRTR
ncbi:MAG TPA: hypothetical protein VM869_02275 [Enhygromyxa sp.]|nr:hypothetical protein [Enhygromyxa sp.]